MSRCTTTENDAELRKCKIKTTATTTKPSSPCLQGGRAWAQLKIMTFQNVCYPATQRAFLKYFVLILKKSFATVLITEEKKKAVKYLRTSISPRRDGATLSSAYMTPILSIINNTKKSSSRWSKGLGSLKYKQIKPQNKPIPFFFFF